jgi:hypothetical protein
MEIIYFDDCHHIEAYGIKSSKCLKRVFYINQAHEPDYKTKELVVCNELIRLKFRTNRLGENSFWGSEGFSSNHSYDGIVDEIVSSAFPVKHPIAPPFYVKVYPMNPVFSYCICKRPYLTRYVYLFDAIKLITEYGWRNISDSFQERTSFHIIEIGERILRRKGNEYIKKGIRNDIGVILNRFKKYYRISNSAEFETIITKLLIDFMTIQSTFKIKER